MKAEPFSTEEEYIFLRYDVQPNLFVCEKCGGTYPVQTPCNSKMMIAIGSQFNKEHEACKFPVDPSAKGGCEIVITPRSL